MWKRKTTAVVGRQGEDVAAAYLKRRGYRILARNYRRRFGEVDIIARHQGYLVFIEVKTRSSDRFGTPFEAVDQRKQQQLIRIAEEYILHNNLQDQPARFDVVSVITVPGKGQVRVEVLENAFGL